MSYHIMPLYIILYQILSCTTLYDIHYLFYAILSHSCYIVNEKLLCCALHAVVPELISLEVYVLLVNTRRSFLSSFLVAAEKQSSKSLIVSLGVVLAALFITNIFLLVLLCKRDRG